MSTTSTKLKELTTSTELKMSTTSTELKELTELTIINELSKFIRSNMTNDKFSFSSLSKDIKKNIIAFRKQLTNECIIDQLQYLHDNLELYFPKHINNFDLYGHQLISENVWRNTNKKIKELFPVNVIEDVNKLQYFLNTYANHGFIKENILIYCNPNEEYLYPIFKHNENKKVNYVVNTMTMFDGSFIKDPYKNKDFRFYITPQFNNNKSKLMITDSIKVYNYVVKSEDIEFDCFQNTWHRFKFEDILKLK